MFPQHGFPYFTKVYDLLARDNLVVALDNHTFLRWRIQELPVQSVYTETARKLWDQFIVAAVGVWSFDIKDCVQLFALFTSQVTQFFLVELQHSYVVYELEGTIEP